MRRPVRLPHFFDFLKSRKSATQYLYLKIQDQ